MGSLLRKDSPGTCPVNTYLSSKTSRPDLAAHGVLAMLPYPQGRFIGERRSQVMKIILSVLMIAAVGWAQTASAETSSSRSRRS